MRPDSSGHFDEFGGKYVIETLLPALEQLEEVYNKAKKDPNFNREFHRYLSEYAGRPTPLHFARRLTEKFGGAKIYLKREDLCHTGAHKINNTLGQMLLTQRMGKRKVIAETGAGQHGVATATAAALFGFECQIFMGEEDIKRQSLNVFKMKLLGAKVTKVTSGTKTLKDAMNEALRYWIATVEDTHYVIGSAAGPHPYPMMVRDFQSVIGQEAKIQIIAREGRLPNHLVACVGGGSNAIGIFHPFYDDKTVSFTGVEAGGHGVTTGAHGASLLKGKVGVFHGSKSFVLQDKNNQISPAHSISAGLDYPGVGPEHSFYKKTKRAKYVTIKDREALRWFKDLSRLEGITPALESAHAIAYAEKLAPKLKNSDIIIVSLSGRGDKDVYQVAEIMGEKI